MVADPHGAVYTTRAYSSDDCSGNPLTEIETTTVDDDGCVVAGGVYSFVTDCEATAGGSLLSHYYDTLDCSGPERENTYDHVGTVEASTCQNAFVAECQSFYRAMDCGGCVSDNDFPNIDFEQFASLNGHNTPPHSTDSHAPSVAS